VDEKRRDELTEQPEEELQLEELDLELEELDLDSGEEEFPAETASAPEEIISEGEEPAPAEDDLATEEEVPADEEPAPEKDIPAEDEDENYLPSGKKDYVRRDQLPREKKKGAGLRNAGIAAAVLVLCLGGAYVFGAQKYRKVFFPNTSVNGVPVEGLTADETVELLNQEVRDYSLKLSGREADPVTITAADAGLHYDFGDSFDRLIAGQNPYAYGLSWFSGKEYRIDTLAKVDEDAFQTVLSGIPFLQKENFRAPVDAVLTDYVPGSGYAIVPEQQGTALDSAAAENEIRSAICGMESELDLEQKEGMYQAPAVTQDNSTLVARRDALNRFVNTEIRYQEGGSLALTGELIKDWLVMGEGDHITLNEAPVREFVKTVAGTYDTYNKSKPFRTSWGQDITIRGGSYGWRVNQDAETAWLLSAIQSGQKADRMPEFSKTAASHSAADYGSTYVEVNLTAQHLYFYKEGKVVVSSDFVSGNVARGTPTHTGIYQVAYKQKNAVLHGENYETPVDYWMPFNGGEGLHDAKWRGSFGGSIYKTNGSHGCVNLPHSAAEKIYQNISAGTPVIVYSLGGTSAGNAAVAEPETKPAETTAAQPAESAAAAESAGTAQQPGGSQTPQTAPAQTPQPGSTSTQASPESGSGSSQSQTAPGQGVIKPAEPIPSSSAPAESLKPSESAAPGSSSGSGGPGASAGPGESSGQSSPSPQSSSPVPGSSDGPGASSGPGSSAGPGASAPSAPEQSAGPGTVGPAAGPASPAGPGM